MLGFKKGTCGAQNMRGISNITVTTTLQPGRQGNEELCSNNMQHVFIAPSTELLAPRSFLKNMKTCTGQSKKGSIKRMAANIALTRPSTTLVPMLMKNKFKKNTIEAALPKTVPDAVASMRKTERFLASSVVFACCFCSLESSAGASQPEFVTNASVSRSSLPETVISKETSTALDSNALGRGAYLQAAKKPTKETNAAINLAANR